jgi:hypothetical protein
MLTDGGFARDAGNYFRSPPFIQSGDVQGLLA